MIADISGRETVSVGEANIPEDFKEKMKVSGSDTLYLGADPQSPQIGDLRVRFHSTPPAEVSVVAQQHAQSFQPYQSEAGRALRMLEMGTHDAAEMFKHARDSNKMLTWILRAVGAGMMLGGLALLMSPLAVLGDVITILGSIIQGGTLIVAGLITLILSPMTIAVAWIFYRPLVAIPLLFVSVAAAVYLFMRRKSTALPEVMSYDNG